MFYLYRTPGWVSKIFTTCVWDKAASDDASIYLTFDDGPCPGVTEPVLDMLASFHAQASFFCIGKNVASHPRIFERILAEGHAVGNHTYSHLNGWQTSSSEYLADIQRADRYIPSDLFRPPYGRILPSQIKQLGLLPNPKKICMWSLLSGDFDMNLKPEVCTLKILERIRPGDIVVFHDSWKAAPRLLHALPAVLKSIRERGWSMKALS